MAEARMKELKSDIDELNVLLKQSQRKRIQDLLSLEIRKLEALWLNLKESTATSTAPVDVSPIPTTSATVPNKRYQVKLNGYCWDQSDNYIEVFVRLKNVQNLPKEQVYCELTEKSMKLIVENLENKDYILIINKLLQPINISKSHWKQKTDMVVIFLAKQNPSTKWSHMTEIEKIEDKRSNESFQESKDPDKTFMNLLKDMYDKGDDEMKRNISKAWYEAQLKSTKNPVDL